MNFNHDKQTRRKHEADTAALYALVRDGRAPWKRLPKKERQWWLNGGSDDAEDRGLADPWNGPTYQNDDGELYCGTEYELALNRLKERELAAAGHRPCVIPAHVTRFGGSLFETTAITTRCERDCEACFREASEIADEWVKESPKTDAFVHQTTLGPQRFYGLVDYSSLDPKQALEESLDDLEVLEMSQIAAELDVRPKKTQRKKR